MARGENEGIRFLTKRGVPPGAQQLVLTFGIVAIVGVGFGAYKVGERFRMFRGGMSDDAHVVTQWDGDAAIGADVNGDGVEDVLGMYAGVDPGGIYFGAFNGKTGRIVWRTGPFGSLERPMGGGLPQFGKQGDLLMINQRGDARIVQVADGKEVGKLVLPSARSVCAGATPEAPLLVTTNRADANFEVDLATRSVKPLAGRPLCHRSMARSKLVDEKALAAERPMLFAVADGNDVAGVFIDANKSAVVQGFALGKPEALWTARLGAQAVVVRGPQQLDIANGRVVVGYAPTPGGQGTVVALDAKSGKEQWRTPVEAPGPLNNLSATDQRVYVAVGKFLTVLDASTGKHERGYGRGDE